MTNLCNKVLERVKEQSSYQPEKWMSNLAIGSMRLKEGNTFARTVWLHLLDNVCGHLAKVIETWDLHCGLDHVESCSPPCIRQIYNQMQLVVTMDSHATQNMYDIQVTISEFFGAFCLSTTIVQ